MKKIFVCLLLLLSSGVAHAQTASYPSPEFNVLNVLLRAGSRANLDNVQATVSSNAGLQLLSTTGMLPGATVVETGFYNQGDETPATYVYSASACPTTAYGAAETPALGGGCFDLVVGGPVVDVRWWGPVGGGVDPNSNNATLLNYFFAYYATLHASGIFDAPAIEWAGINYGINSTVTDSTYNDHILDGPMFKALSGLGGGAPTSINPNGGNVCPAMFQTVNNGIHKYDHMQMDGNYQAVYLYEQNANGTTQWISPAGKHWQGSCGGPTPQMGTEAAGSNIVLMNNTNGYIPGQVIHETTGDLPFNDQIVRVDANTDIVLRLPANFTGSEPIYAYNDSGGYVWGVNGTNAGGSVLGQANVNEYQTGDADLGVPADQFGYSFMATGGYTSGTWAGANDLQVANGLWQNASGVMFWGPNTSGHYSGHQEINNDAGITGTSTASTIAGGILTVGGTITGSYLFGMSISYTGMTGGPYYIEPGGTGTGGAGTYDLSGSPANVSSATAIGATNAQPTPACILMAAGAGTVVVDEADFGGCNIQPFQAASTSPINLDVHAAKFSSSNFATGMSGLVQAWSDQTNTPLSGMTVNLFNSNFISGLSYIVTGGPGTWTGTNNQFTGPLNLSGAINAAGAIVAGSNSKIEGGDVVAQGTAVPGYGFNNLGGNTVTLYANSQAALSITSSTGGVATLNNQPLILSGPMEGNSSSSVTASVGSGAGTGGTVTPTSTSHSLDGSVTVVTGTSPAASSTITTITLGNTFNNAPVCPLVPGNAAAAALSGAALPYFTSAVGAITLKSGSTALAASTTYIWSYGPCAS